MKNSKWLDENDSEWWILFPNGSKLAIIAQKSLELFSKNFYKCEIFIKIFERFEKYKF